MSYEYDVALSFAGEDRKFVEDCAEILRSLNIIFSTSARKFIQKTGYKFYSHLSSITYGQFIIYNV